MTPTLQHMVEERLCVPLVVSYGLSEATCTCTMNPAGWTRRVGAAGLALVDEVVSVLDSEDQRCRWAT